METIDEDQAELAKSLKQLYIFPSHNPYYFSTLSRNRSTSE